MMPEIKPFKILSFSSEDEFYPAKNLLRGSSSYQWKSKNSLNTQEYVEFQFESLTKFSRMDIGNSSSAFIEVQASCITDHENYEVLLGSTPLMSPSESLKCEKLNRVRCFKEINFTKSVASKKWNVLKVICTQPFNKTLQYGLSFIKFYEMYLNENDEYLGEKVQLNESNIDLAKLLTAKSIDVENWRPGSLFMNRTKTDSAIHEEIKIKNTEFQKSTDNSEIEISPMAVLNKKTEDNVYRSHSNLTSTDVKFPRMKSSISLKRKYDSLDSGISEVKGAVQHIDNQSELLKSQTDIKSIKSKTFEINKANIITPTTSNSQSKINGGRVSQLEQKTSVDDLPRASISSLNSLYPSSSALNNSIFANVIFVLSGFQNPLRNKIRDKALSLGAQYRASWVDDCTHLICAYHNTPKFKEVCGKGIIVTEKWIFDCYNEKKMLPWRKYRVTGALSPVKSISNSYSIESINSVNRNQNLSYDTGISFQSNADQCATDDPLTLNTTCNDPIPKLPDVFTGQDFFFYGDFDNEELRQLKRLIIAFNGKVHTFMSCEVRIVLTHSIWDEHFDEALDSNSHLKFVKPEWIYLCDERGSLAPLDEFELLK